MNRPLYQGNRCTLLLYPEKRYESLWLCRYTASLDGTDLYFEQSDLLFTSKELSIQASLCEIESALLCRIDPFTRKKRKDLTKEQTEQLNDLLSALAVVQKHKKEGVCFFEPSSASLIEGETYRDRKGQLVKIEEVCEEDNAAYGCFIEQYDSFCRAAFLFQADQPLYSVWEANGKHTTHDELDLLAAVPRQISLC